MNARQNGASSRVLDGMEGKLTNAKWAAIGRCSADTALRGINHLLARGVLCKLGGGVRRMSFVSSRPQALDRVYSAVQHPDELLTNQLQLPKKLTDDWACACCLSEIFGAILGRVRLHGLSAQPRTFRLFLTDFGAT